MPEGFDKLAGDVGKAIETVPDVYDDAFKPATQELGKTLALIPRIINAALVPLRQWITEREYKIAETEKLLAQKLEHVGEDKIVTPEAYVAIPAIQAISYSMDNEELRNLYANLLAKAMNLDTQSLVHPSFVEIIKQLSPLDVLAINNVKYLCNYQPLIRIFACEEKPIPNERMVIHGMSDFGDASTKKPLFSHYSLPITKLETTPEQRGFVIQNLNRLGLINIDYREHIIDAIQYKPLYDQLLESSLYKRLINQTTQENLHLQLTDGYTSPTDFGRWFFNICCQ